MRVLLVIAVGEFSAQTTQQYGVIVTLHMWQALEHQVPLGLSKHMWTPFLRNVDDADAHISAGEFCASIDLFRFVRPTVVCIISCL